MASIALNAEINGKTEIRSLTAAIADQRQKFESRRMHNQTENPTEASEQNSSNTLYQSNLKIYKSLNEFEKKLSEFTASISQYNYEPKIAKELVESDHDLCESVTELVEYQTNMRKISELEAVSKSLDLKLTELLNSLADARSQLVGSTISNESEDMQDKYRESSASGVPYGELLAYATKIANFSTAPASLLARPYARDPAQVDQQPPLTTTSAAIGPGPTSTTALGVEKQSDPIANDIEIALKQVANSKVTGVQVVFPWPTEDDLRRSILSSTDVVKSLVHDDQTHDEMQGVESSRQINDI
ncbi:vitamin-D-receptor interacting mediator subunit 4-domain-containing protein [Lipomyces oligophaga]|uniref:vitamin-D-receptor interacting mediator subunit 4-domain-containing protein n=1 Tax=Lipomyces oligophaga TaxID=45792 RepID=UPI0034CE2F2C